jgi:hypothetical protein
MTRGQVFSVTSFVVISNWELREGMEEHTYSQRILIVTVANLFADVLGVRSSVYETLRVVNIAIFRSTGDSSASIVTVQSSVLPSVVCDI